MQFSKHAFKLLKLFYAHPGQQFYIQELGRLLKVKPGVFQRALYKLERQGVLRSSYQANARFFRLNKDYPFYKEFMAIVSKTARCAAIAIAFVLLPCGGRQNPCAQDQGKALTLSSLQEAISIAYAHNKDIQIQEYELKVADADILGAKSAFLPKVDFNAAYTRNGAVLNSTSPSTAKKDIRIFSGFKDNNTMGVTVKDNIYNGGANIANLRQTQIGLKEQVETLRATKLNVELDAKRLYYGLLLAYETKRIAENLVGQAQSHYEEVKSKLEQGTVSRFDCLQSKVQVSLLMPQLINAQNSIELIIAEMDKLLGIKAGEKIIINDALIYAPIEVRESDFLSEAYLNEPEMILKSLGIDMNKWAIQYARAGWLPQLDAAAGYNYTSNNLGNMFNRRHSNWSFGFALRIPIFDGFSTKAKVDAARARYSQSLISKENLADQVAVDVKSACLDMVQAAEVIKSQQDNLQDAKEALEISYVRYNNGVGINLDVMDAQVSLANVEKNLAEGTYDYIMAMARLDRLMGKSSMEAK
jgi:outer membrane protein TolC